MKFFLYISVFLALVFTGCNEGLAPTELSDKTTINGIVIYKNGISDWPPADSIKDLRVAAFKNYPPNNIISEIISKNAYFTETMPFNVSSSTFSLDIADAPAEIKYIAIAQNFGELLDWRVLGVYTLSGDNSQPTPISVKKGKTYNIDINVDFKNLPPQPF